MQHELGATVPSPCPPGRFSSPLRPGAEAVALYDDGIPLVATQVPLDYLNSSP